MNVNLTSNQQTTIKTPCKLGEGVIKILFQFGKCSLIQKFK